MPSSYLAHRDDLNHANYRYVGSSNLTFAGLKGQGELNVDVLDRMLPRSLPIGLLTGGMIRGASILAKNFVRLSKKAGRGKRIIPPHHVYLKMAWHLSQDAREGIKEFRVFADIRDQLLPFQEKAVQLACRQLNKHGGVLVGDVVGLGKTRIAAAIARVMAMTRCWRPSFSALRTSPQCGRNTREDSGCAPPKVCFPQSVAQAFSRSSRDIG
ncbi:MAG: hypothetical protein R3F11_15170 [Verrucomicrobiales bacterium]